MWDFIKRKQELAGNSERVAYLRSLQAKDNRSLTQQDMVNAAAVLNVKPTHLAAFYYVESSGKGFAADGRLKILYEPHAVSRATRGAFDKRLFDWTWNGKAMQIPLSYRRWVPLDIETRSNPNIWHPYKENHAGQWEMLCTMYELDERALEGVSWGGFQIMGFNARSLGYASPLAMVLEMYQGEAAHLEAALRFLKMRNLIGALRDGKWKALAEGYNGSGNVYAFAGKLQRQVERLERAYV